jgi:hypothetical protein
MPYFQDSTSLDSSTLIKKFLSTDLNASWPQIGQYGIGFGTLVGSFGDPLGLTFHNLIGGLFVGLQMLSMGETTQLNKSTRNLKRCIKICPTKVFGPSFNNQR